MKFWANVNSFEMSLISSALAKMSSIFAGIAANSYNNLLYKSSLMLPFCLAVARAIIANTVT